MTSILKLLVQDVNGMPVADAQARISFLPEGVAPTTSVTVVAQTGIQVAEGVSSITVDISHPDYFPQTVTIIPGQKDQPWRWDDAASKINASPPQIMLIVPLGRVREAPVTLLPESALTNYQGTPSGVLLTDDPYRGLIYRSLFNGLIEDFRRLQAKVIGDIKAQEWKRLRYDKVSVDPWSNGRFIWIEYGDPGHQDRIPTRFLVGLWVPTLVGPLAPGLLDFVMFYSPTTNVEAGYPSHDYPYVITKVGNSVRQPYVELGQGYMFNDKFLVYQLMAAKRQAIFVMPISPYGKWGPFLYQEGVQRLLKEVCQFVHRRNLTKAQEAGTSGLVYSGERVGHVSRPIFAVHPATPSVRKVAIAYFSAGVNPSTTMMQSLRIPENERAFPAKLFGADPRPFDAAWTELWDLDGAPGITIGWPKYAEIILKWFRYSPTRQLRMYHTRYTDGNAVLKTSLQMLLNAVTPTVSGPTWERHANDGRWTYVYFEKDYLDYCCYPDPPPPYQPLFLHNDDHHSVPRIGLGNAVLLSQLIQR